MHLPILQAREQVLITPYFWTYSVLVGFAAYSKSAQILIRCWYLEIPTMPTREPISLHEARSALSTISSLDVLVMSIDFPSTESIAHGTSSPGLWAAKVVCQ